MAGNRTINRFDVRDYDGKYGMYCNSKDKASIFCRYMDSTGRTYTDGERYVSNTYFSLYRGGPVYLFNEGCIVATSVARRSGHEVIDFDEFDWGLNYTNKMDELCKLLRIEINKPFRLKDNRDGLLFGTYRIINGDKSGFELINTCTGNNADNKLIHILGGRFSVINEQEAVVEELLAERITNYTSEQFCKDFAYMCEHCEEIDAACPGCPILDMPDNKDRVCNEYMIKHPEVVTEVVLKWNICRECGVQYYE